MASAYFGWDLLYKSVEKDIKGKNDILVCLAHFVLVSNGFKCIGLGESKTFDGSEPKSEALPDKWNENYGIRYVYQGRLYNFKATMLDDGVMVNLVRVDERTVSLVQLNTKSVAQTSGTLDEMIPDNRSIIDTIKNNLINKVVMSKKSRCASVQTDPERSTSRASSDRSPSNWVPPDPFSRYSDPNLPYRNPLGVGVGRNDLDPLGGFPPLMNPNRGIIPGGGGGMIYQPPELPRPGGGGNLGVPPGSIPPGARFDPFRAPDNQYPRPRGPNRPDNDEFPPPGYDDMFM